jgi:hypothetical protein
VEKFVEWRLAGETVLEEKLPQRHFVHHKTHMTRPGLEPRAAAVGSQRLTVWAMGRPTSSVIRCIKLRKDLNVAYNRGFSPGNCLQELRKTNK